MSEDMTATLEIILGILFVLFVIGAFICQVVAARHKTPEAAKFMYKDSLFKNKDLVYNETGMRYIRMQKKFAIGIMLICFAFLAIYSNTPVPA